MLVSMSHTDEDNTSARMNEMENQYHRCVVQLLANRVAADLVQT